MKPKASDALCILPVEKCDFNFYVVQWEGWERDKPGYMYMCYRTYSKLYSFLSFLSEKSHEYCSNVFEGGSSYLSLILKLSKVIKDTLCSMHMAAFIS